MANINLTSADLLATAKKIDESSDKIDGALQKLDVVMSDLDSTWSDDNSKKYLARYNELRENFPEFKAAISSYGTFLNSVVEIYEKEYNQNIASRVGRA